MTSRRSFLRAASATAALPFLSPRSLDALERRIEPFRLLDASGAATSQDFWDQIRAMYPTVTDYIHLESGYSSPQPKPTWEAFQRHETMINNGLSFYMRRKRADDLTAVKKELADLAGVPADEIVITRNTTESLGTVIHGMDLEPGDEAIMCNQDYGSMLEQFRQQSRRRGLKLVEISLPLQPKSDDDIVNIYSAAITPRTKVMLVSHMINISGQILPVRKIADMAHARGVRVIIDGAHSFAQVAFTLPQLDGDFFGASLHKWLCVPLGAGLLHMKKERIPEVWPLFGETAVPATDIRKFERYGTHPSWTVLTIPDAIRFHRMIGAERKEARLRYLQQYWTDRVRNIPKIYMNTPAGERACAIANVGVTGIKPTDLATLLFDKYNIYTVGIDNIAVKGVRVTPHLFTTTGDLDKLVRALTEIARSA